ncbi:DUF3052 domain-containing protein [Micrococcoides hystricis]|uniref:DUF3052 domain-containing protein n=1 Tax=Micrococcoides hystricis TaxID=1572761 RepID=A0ABV6PEA7_9MICC
MSQPDAATVSGSAAEESSAPSEAAKKLAATLGFKEGDYVQELGYDEDIDFDLRDNLEDGIDSDLLTEEDHEVVDGVLLWWRHEDGDLVDGLVDALTNLDEGGSIWLLTPKRGQEGEVNPVEISQAAPTAGLHVTKSADLSPTWLAHRLVARGN